MSFSITQKGVKDVHNALFALAQRSPRLLIESVDEVNKRHAQAYKRRTIPVDTGRLKTSLTTVSNPDRLVIATVKYIEIGTKVPYAKYQRKRIRELTSQEVKFIFVEPILESFRELLAGRG